MKKLGARNRAQLVTMAQERKPQVAGFIPALKEDTMTTAYCVKCKKNVEIKNPREVILKNNARAVRGVCSVCGAKVFRLGKA